MEERLNARDLLNSVENEQAAAGSITNITTEAKSIHEQQNDISRSSNIQTLEADRLETPVISAASSRENLNQEQHNQASTWKLII